MHARAARRAACVGALDHQDRGAFAEAQAGAAAVERPARLGRQRVQRVEAGEDRAAERLGAARDHGVGAAEPDPVERDAERGARSTSTRC